MKKRILITLAVLSIVANTLTAQNNVPQPQDLQALPSWESYEFMKYGKVGASLYTGTVNYSVPIYSYKDNDFEYSLSVDYATNGLRVNHDSGILGHGWSLSYPGLVTREVCGIPDEYDNLCDGTYLDKDLLGYMKRHSTGYFTRGVVTFLDNKSYPCHIFQSDRAVAYETEPDIYSFNFCGYRGNFHMSYNENGQRCFVIYNTNTDSRCIDIKQFNINSIGDIEIAFIDGKGYEYLFQKGEYIYDYLGNWDAGTTMMRELIQSWYLHKIIAPNGRKIEFSYEYKSNLVGVREAKSLYRPTMYYHYAVTDNYQPIIEYKQERRIEETKIYQPLLTKINFPDGSVIQLAYEDAEKEYRYINTQNIQEIVNNNSRVKNVSISRDNKNIRKVVFSYNVLRPKLGNTFTFLKNIDISGVGTYSFDYYAMAGYPALGTISSDHWGYYNGRNQGFLSDIIKNNLVYNEKGEESYTSSAHKNPDFEASLSGSLKRISYPTGGYSDITYESHDCSKKVIRNYESYFYPHLHEIGKDETVGGIRIKSICTTDGGIGNSDTLTYRYEDSRGLSSGILLHVPRYGVKYEAVGINRTCRKTVENYNLSNYIYDTNSTHIEYSVIKEYRNSKLQSVYYYNTYEDYPDKYDFDEDYRINKSEFWGSYHNEASIDEDINTIVQIFFDSTARVLNCLKPVPSSQIKRGLLKRELHYNNGVLQNQKELTYFFPEVAIDEVYVIVGEHSQLIRHPRYNIELFQQLDTKYGDGNKIVSCEQISYNKYGDIMIKFTHGSKDDDFFIERIHYVGDSKNVNGTTAQMFNHHLMSYPLKHETFSVKSEKETLLSRKEYTYIQPNPANESLIKVGQVKEYSGTNSLKTVTEYEYDDLGYVRQQKSTDGVPTSYLWSYNGKFPVVKAGNVAFTALQSALAGKGLGVTALRDMADVDNSTFGKLLGIRSLLSASPVEVFKYDPTAGMTERTASNSLKTFYNYDRYARLISITDNNGETLEKRSYNIVTLKEDDDTTINGNNE